jgi:ribosomal protein S18 acetylase RimI-like enzyme
VTTSEPQRPGIRTSIDRVERLDSADMHDLCDATDMAILDGGGFGWLDIPPRETLEAFWRGVLAVPERELFVVRLGGTICGSGQLILPSRNDESQRHASQIKSAFIAPWARGHGLARDLTLALEARARALKFTILNLDVRETQEAAIRMYDTLGYIRWGTHPSYAFVKGEMIEGFYYYKNLKQTDLPKR